MINFLQNFKVQTLLSYLEKFNLGVFFKFFIRLYQATFSYFLGGNCRYYPSCSHYAYEAFTKHSVLKATWFTIKRLLSCHPFSNKNFYDPVPLNNEEKRVSNHE